MWASEDVLLRKLEYLCPKPPRTVRLFQLEQGRQHIEFGVMLRDVQVQLVREFTWRTGSSQMPPFLYSALS